MNTLILTDTFMSWLTAMKDMRAKAHILARLDRAKKGNFGDHKRLNEYLYEMRMTQGAGYRVYYTVKSSCVYIVLVGGDKKSQSKDIEQANALIAELVSSFSKECTE